MPFTPLQEEPESRFTPISTGRFTPSEEPELPEFSETEPPDTIAPTPQPISDKLTGRNLGAIQPTEQPRGFTPISRDPISDDTHTEVFGQSLSSGILTSLPETGIALGNISDKLDDLGLPLWAAGGLAIPLKITRLAQDPLKAFVAKVNEVFKPKIKPGDKSKEVIATIGAGIGDLATNITAGGFPAYIARVGIHKTDDAIKAGASLPAAAAVGTASSAMTYLSFVIPAKIVAAPGLNLIQRIAAGTVTNIPAQVSRTAIEMSVLDKAVGIEHTPEEKEARIYLSMAEGGLFTFAQVLKFTSPKVQKIIKRERLVGSGATAAARAQAEAARITKGIPRPAPTQEVAIRSTTGALTPSAAPIPVGFRAPVRLASGQLPPDISPEQIAAEDRAILETAQQDIIEVDEKLSKLKDTAQDAFKAKGLRSQKRFLEKKVKGLTPKEKKFAHAPVKARKGTEFISLSNSEITSLQIVQKEVEQGEAARKIPKKDKSGNVIGTTVEGGTLPEYFKGKGYNKKDTLIAIDKALKGQSLTPNQTLIVKDLNTGYREQTARQITEGRARFTPIEDDVDSFQFGALSPSQQSSQAFEEKSGLYTVSNEKPLIEMPELVELTRSINEGKSPIVKEKLRNALGRLTSKPGSLGEADISLRADIFTGDLIGQRAVKTKEADSEFVFFKQEVIEAAEESGLDTNNIIFKKDFNKRTGRVELKAYQKNPQLAPNVMSHEIGHLIDYLPDKDIRRGNVLGRIKVLKKHLVQTIDALPTDPSKVLTTKERSALRRQAARSAGPRPDKESVEFKAWQETARGGYQVLLRNEIQARGLITRDEVMAELKNVSQTRKPFDAAGDDNYTKYRYSSPELYADAISAYITTPEMFRNTAPKFRKSFLAYLDKKPHVKTKLGELIDRGKASREALVDTRIDKLYNMMGEGNKARQELNERNLQDKEGIRDTLMRGLIDKYHSSLKQVRLQERRGGDIGKNARQARYDLEETQYIASESENYFFNLDKNIIQVMESQGATTDDIGLYMFANRVANERGDIANPLGHTRESATEIIKSLPARWGAQRFNAVVKAVTDFNKMRNDLVISRVAESGLFTPELIETIKNNPDYAKFSVQKFLDDKFGGGMTSKIYKQIGTLSEVENPFIATVLQDISLMRASAINNSKVSLVDTMGQMPDILSPAEMKWSTDRKARVPVEPKNPKLGILTIMEDGKPQHFYTSKAIVDTYKVAPFEATKIAEVWAAFNAPVRAILVNKNPLWMARNVVKDLRATIKNNPEVRLRDVPKLLVDYRNAFGEAWKDVMRGEKSADIQELLSQRALLSDRAYKTREATPDDELERLANQFSIVAETESTGAYSKLKKAWDFLDKLGKVSERTGKVAGFKYLKNRTDLPARDIAHRVRTRIGTPDVKRQGAWQAITNNLFMFSNVNKEGIRASYESYKDDKGAYIWKTIAMNMLPKLALAGMTYAALRSDDDDLKRYYANISEYDMKNYTVVPLFLTEDNKTVYLRIPEDYQGQLFGALAWDGAHSKLIGKDSVVSSLGEASPYKLNPLMEVGLDLVTYYVNGNNPQDDFRGRPVIPNLAFQTGGPEANKAIVKHVWTSLGGNAIYRPSYNIVRDKSSINKILSVPPFNVLGAFVRISDRGTSERYYKTLREERKGKAKDSLARQRTIINGVNSGLDNDAILNELEKLDLFTSNAISQTRKYRALKVDSPEVNAYAQARSNKERQQLEKEFRKTMSEAEVDRIIDIWAEWKSDDQ